MKRVIASIAGVLFSSVVWAQNVVFMCDNPVPRDERSITVVSDQEGNIIEYDVYTTRHKCYEIAHDIQKLMLRVDVNYLVRVLESPDRCFTDDGAEIPCFVPCTQDDVRLECAR